MRRHVTPLLVSVLVASAANAQARRVIPDAVRAALDEVIDAAVRQHATPGFALAIVDAHGILYRRDAGFADIEAGRRVTPQTVFYIASSTKSFTALATMLMDKDGVLDLDMPLARALPGVRWASGIAANEIPFRDLFTHTHGINDGPVSYRAAFSGQIERREMLSALSAHEPGSWGRTFRYSNLGYNIASLAIDSIAKKSWKDVLDERIFQPLEMRSTTGYVSRVARDRLAMPYRVSPEGLSRLPYAKGDANMQSAGGLVSTIDDLSRWVSVQLGEGRLGGKQIFPAEIIREAHRIHARHEQMFDGIARHGYGMGWQRGTLDGDTLVHHFGGFPGFAAHVSFMPQHRIGIVAFANGGVGPQVQGVITSYAYALVANKAQAAARYRARLDSLPALVSQRRSAVAADLERRRARPQVTALPIESYAGRYENPAWGRIDARVKDGTLVITWGLLEGVAEVFDGSKHQLRVELSPGEGQVVTFTVDGGRVTGASSNGVTFERVKSGA
jgi:CubicO group peptidase (beta-lactamase class C family)